MKERDRHMDKATKEKIDDILHRMETIREEIASIQFSAEFEKHDSCQEIRFDMLQSAQDHVEESQSDIGAFLLASDWQVEANTASVIHRPTGMKIRFKDGEGELVVDPPQYLVASWGADAPANLARLMREAGEVWKTHLEYLEGLR